MLVSDPDQLARWRDLRTRILASSPAEARDCFEASATQARLSVLEVISRAGLGHVGGDLSVTDILTVLYLGVLRINPEEPTWADRDRFILSKGHAAVSLYTRLALSGFFAPSKLTSFAEPLSPFNGHPDRNKVPGVETNTGPLGHGLPFGVGAAIAARLSGSSRQIFVVVGDGELQEGSNWEAIMTAGHRGLSNLVTIVDRNRLQQGARTEETNRLDPLDDRWRSFGWNVVELDGHDHLALFDAFRQPAGVAPTCVIANTVKARGVSFMEDRAEWHHKVPTAEQVALARLELTR